MTKVTLNDAISTLSLIGKLRVLTLHKIIKGIRELFLAAQANANVRIYFYRDSNGSHTDRRYLKVKDETFIPELLLHGTELCLVVRENDEQATFAIRGLLHNKIFGMQQFIKLTRNILAKQIEIPNAQEAAVHDFVRDGSLMAAKHFLPEGDELLKAVELWGIKHTLTSHNINHFPQKYFDLPSKSNLYEHLLQYARKVLGLNTHDIRTLVMDAIRSGKLYPNELLEIAPCVQYLKGDEEDYNELVSDFAHPEVLQKMQYGGEKLSMWLGIGYLHGKAGTKQRKFEVQQRLTELLAEGKLSTVLELVDSNSVLVWVFDSSLPTAKDTALFLIEAAVKLAEERNEFGIAAALMHWAITKQSSKWSFDHIAQNTQKALWLKQPISLN